MTYPINANPIVCHRINLTSTDPRAYEIWDHFWKEEIPGKEKTVYFAENLTEKMGDAVFYTRTIRGMVNLFSLIGSTLNERMIKLRKREIDQMIKTTITVLDDSDFITGENLLH
jgi:hypothetical protein